MNRINLFNIYIDRRVYKGGNALQEIEMIKKIQKGDMQAFEQVFERYKSKALKTVYLMTGDKVVSEDVVQEAFVKCYSSIKSLRHPEYFKTWFFKLLIRTTWQYMKKEKKILPAEGILEMVEEKCAQSYLVKLEQEAAINVLYEEMSKLDIKLQTTLTLYYYGGFSVKEIANIMGCFEGTVKSRLYTGRNKLKNNLLAQHNFISEGGFTV